MSGVDTFDRDGLTFAVRDTGPSDGPVVVLLHGFPQDAGAFDAVAALLAAQGLRVLAPDQRGYSPGARPDGRAAYAMRELVDDVVALLDTAGVERAHVVGHDWGGAVAWALGSRRAERTGSVTALGAPHPAAVVHSLARSDQALRLAYMAGFQVPRLPERLLLAGDGAWLRRALVSSGMPPDRAAACTRRMLEPGALTGALSWYRAIPASRRFGAGVVRVPAALVHGRRDPFIAPATVRATGRYVRGPLRTVGLDAGHWLPEEVPAEVVRVVLGLVRTTVRP